VEIRLLSYTIRNVTLADNHLLVTTTAFSKEFMKVSSPLKVLIILNKRSPESLSCSFLLTMILFQLIYVFFSATTISFGFVGPTDTGGIKIKAYAVQYKEVKQSWDEGRNKSWPVGKYLLHHEINSVNRLYRLSGVERKLSFPQADLIRGSIRFFCNNKTILRVLIFITIILYNIFYLKQS